jgi:predicted GIY-YIG superfamily endonuclease
MYYVYAISSLVRNYIYVGLTDNIERRLSEHNTGKNKTTKPFGSISSKEEDSQEFNIDFS